MPQGEEKFYKQTTLPSFADENPPTALPEKIGPYKIETLLAQGGMSLLYLAIDTRTREPRVIKVLLPEFTNHPEMVDHFFWEAKIIGLTNHPNIVKVYDFGQTKDGLYIAMEFIQGVTLRQFLMQQSFSLKRCLDIILQVAYALCHLHTHGVIHRDLKPENILISEDGEVKVIDFGIAQLHEEERPRFLHKMIGTPSYMSPEQKENPANASFASDIYSLGIIAYELILGKLSYGLVNVSLLPAGLQKIISKAIAVSKEERYEDIVDFITDLTSYYKSTAIEKERPSNDRLMEYNETLQKADMALSNFEKPHWGTQLDIGIAKDRNLDQTGLYLDFFKLANNTLAIVLAHTHSHSLTSSLPMAVVRGMIRTLMDRHLSHTDALNLPAFAERLNYLVNHDKLKETFHFSLLKIIPQTDSLLFLSSALSPLLHIAQGSNKARTIHADNPLIGLEPGTSFIDAGDNFNDGDTLVLHSLPKDPFHHIFEQVLQQNSLLSPHRLSETLLAAAARHELYPDIDHPKVVIVLQRIA